MQPGISEEWFLMGGLKQAGEPPGILSEQLLSGENKVVRAASPGLACRKVCLDKNTGAIKYRQAD